MTVTRVTADLLRRRDHAARATIRRASTTRGGSRSRTASARSSSTQYGVGALRHQRHRRVRAPLPDGGVARDRAPAGRGPLHQSLASCASSTASTSSARRWPWTSRAACVLPQLLRESAAMAGEVSVLGLQNHLAVWNQKRLQERLFKKEPFTDEDGRVLSGVRDLMWRSAPRARPARGDAGAARGEAGRPLRRRHASAWAATPRRSCAAARPTAGSSASTATRETLERARERARAASASACASCTPTSARSRALLGGERAGRHPARPRRRARCSSTPPSAASASSADGPLDMRMDRSGGVHRGRRREPPAARRSSPTSSTATARSARRGASRARIVRRARARAASRPRPSWPTVVRRAAGRARRPGLDPATRTFQALRIHVNRELEGLGDALARARRAASPRAAAWP